MYISASIQLDRFKVRALGHSKEGIIIYPATAEIDAFKLATMRSHMA